MASTSIEWGGRTWYKNKRDGYYRSRAGKLLHRAIWESEHGPIPDRCHIHHKNEDRQDNSIENLECLQPGEHMRKHEPKGYLKWDQAVRSGASAKYWAAKQPSERACRFCGTRFVSTGQRSAFCSNACRSADRRMSGIDNETRQCALCGGEFIVNKYTLQRCCSHSCSSRLCLARPSPRLQLDG